MKLHLNQNGASNRFTGHGKGFLAVNGQRHDKALVVSPDALHVDWPATDAGTLDDAQLQFVLDLRPEIVLLGTGARQSFPSVTVLRTFAEARIGLETMDSAAACRTYNILADEGRKVVAAVFPP
jgi:uncharacterized protein